MDIVLLTHDREINKLTNTGKLVRQCLGGRARLIIWERKNPSAFLLDLLSNNKAALLCPDSKCEDSRCIDSSSIDKYEAYVIIDATWQQARKIYNQSEYLKSAAKVSISSNSLSVFQRRRNQVEGGLCTAECAISLLELNSENILAGQLNHMFKEFNERV